MFLGMNLEEYCIQNNMEYILDEWDYEDNKDLRPSDFAPKSNKSVNWKCKYGHIWSARIADRTFGRNCSVCAGKIVLVGFNDLKTLNPGLCEEWNYEKNNGLIPEQFTLKSGKEVWWKCKVCGHEWPSKISNRSNGSGCPNCLNIKNGERTIKNQIAKNGSLKDSGLEYVEEWDYNKNNIDPSQVAIFSNTAYWWKCKKCGHEWTASPNSRSQGRGCPVCNSVIPNQKKIQLHINRDGSFADNHPEFMKYWDFELNDKSCYELTRNSTYVAHWHCPDCDCRWERSLVYMSNSKGCPRCVENQEISSIQRKTQDYILNSYNYELRHEKDCSVIPKNPKTNYPMPYDNEVIISNDKRLIIEVNGEQHYKITAYIIMDAKKHNVTPQEELEYLQWKDSYKKQYALNNGYFYLALPYWAFDDDSYMKLIDEKIQSILS